MTIAQVIHKPFKVSDAVSSQQYSVTMPRKNNNGGGTFDSEFVSPIKECMYR